MAEILFNVFADEAALQQQKENIVGIFAEIKAGILDLNKAGIKLDASKSVNQTANAIKEYSSIVDALTKKEQELATAQKKIAEMQAQIAVIMAKTTEESKKQESAIRGLSTELSENIQRQVQLKDRLKEVQDNLKKLSQFKDAAKDTQQFNEEVIRLTAEQAQLKIEIQATNKAINNQTKEMLSSSGSIDEQRARVNRLTQVYDSLSDAQRNSEEGQALKKQIADIDAELKKLEGATGRFQRNVGNYANSLASGFENVRREIARLQSEQKTLSVRGDSRGAEAASRAISELEQIQKVALNTNLSYTQTVKQLEREYQNLAVSGNVSNEFLQEFKQFVAEAKDQADDLKQEIKALASDTRSFDLVAGSLTTVVSAFEAGAGAAALFGENNEDVQRSIQKLVAIQSVANGIREVANQLTQKGTAANKIYSAAMAQVAILTGTASTATARFSALLKLTGIGILITGIGLLASKLLSFGSSAKTASDEVKNLAASLDDLNFKTDRSIKNLQRENELLIANLKARGASQSVISAATINNLEKEKKAYQDLAKAALDEYNASGISTGNRVKGYQQAVDLLRLQKAIQQDQDENTRESTKKNTEARINALNKIVDAYDKVLDLDNRIQTTQADANADALKKALEAIEKEKKAKLDLFIYEKQLEAEKQSLLAETEAFTGNFRIEAAKKEADALKSIIQEQQKFDLEQADLTASQKLLINKKASDSIANIEQELQKKIVSIRVQEFQQFRELVDDGTRFYAERAEANQKALEKELAQVKQFRDESIKGLNEAYQQGIITLEELNEKKLRVEFDYQASVLKAQIDFYNKQLELSNLSDEQRMDLKGKIAEAEMQLADLVTQNQINNDERKKKSFEEWKQKALDNLKELENGFNKFADVVGGIFNAIATSQLNDIEAQLEALEKRKAKEIEVVEQTVQNEQDKAAKIKVIEARAQSEKEALERRQKQVKRQQAAFDKANTIAKIIIDTASAVVEALPNIPLSVLSGVLGAAQLAVAIATPLPQFAKGKKASDPYEGPGIVGEAGRELKISKTGKVTLYDKASLIHLAKGDTILPNQVTEDILRANDMTLLASYINQGNSSGSQDKINEFLVEKYEEQIRLLKDIKNKPVHSLIIRNDGQFQAYIDFHIKS